MGCHPPAKEKARLRERVSMQGNKEKFVSLKKLNLPVNGYAITGSGVLGIRNLRAMGDIDIIVSQQLWDVLAAEYGIVVEDGVKKIVLLEGAVEAFSEGSFPLEEGPSVAERIADAEIIEGLPFDRIEHVLYYKRKQGREKDLKDIVLIEQWLKKKKGDFEIEGVVSKPLMAHLSTVAAGEPRDSPVWFIYEKGCFWVFGRDKDSFIQRLKKEARCALGIVDFDVQRGILQHVGVRGRAEMGSVDRERLLRFVSKYLGSDSALWNKWFMENIVDPLDVMVQIIPKTIVAKDASFFKTGPHFGKQ